MPYPARQPAAPASYGSVPHLFLLPAALGEKGPGSGTIRMGIQGSLLLGHTQPVGEGPRTDSQTLLYTSKGA